MTLCQKLLTREGTARYMYNVGSRACNDLPQPQQEVGLRVGVCSQTNWSVGLLKKKKKMEKSWLDIFPCITLAVYFSYFGSVVG